MQQRQQQLCREVYFIGFFLINFRHLNHFSCSYARNIIPYWEICWKQTKTSTCHIAFFITNEHIALTVAYNWCIFEQVKMIGTGVIEDLYCSRICVHSKWNLREDLDGWEGHIFEEYLWAWVCIRGVFQPAFFSETNVSIRKIIDKICRISKWGTNFPVREEDFQQL